MEFLSDREKFRLAIKAILTSMKKLLPFVCFDCGCAYNAWSDSATWHVCPNCERSIKP
jgi:predicted RNA-binding Zn-ribbon protein involved in translation (DUF1610 family)